MIRALLQTVVLILALVAGGFAMGNGAGAAHAAQPPCHAALDAGASFDQAGDLAAPATLGTASSRDRLRHDPGSHQCTDDGTCCDGFCHVALVAPAIDLQSADLPFTSHGLQSDGRLPSRSLEGLDRPPRSVSL